MPTRSLSLEELADVALEALGSQLVEGLEGPVHFAIEGRRQVALGDIAIKGKLLRSPAPLCQKAADVLGDAGIESGVKAVGGRHKAV